MIDTHTHLYSSKFDEDRNEAIQRAILNGVDKFFLPNIDRDSVDGMMQLVQKFPSQCFPMMGLHPCSITKNYQKDMLWVEEWLSKEKFVAIGEIGIDLYWDKSLLKEQQEAFIHQINLAKKYELPIVIHCREAFDEIFEVMDSVNDDKLFGIFHCFTGNLNQANKILSYGDFKLGIGGVLTYKNSDLKKVVKDVSISNIVLETDAPYLPPTPYRGKRNESAYIPIIAQYLSDIYQIPLDEIDRITTQNALEVFKIKEDN